jgi:hypothetical protein
MYNPNKMGNLNTHFVNWCNPFFWIVNCQHIDVVDPINSSSNLYSKVYRSYKKSKVFVKSACCIKPIYTDRSISTLNLNDRSISSFYLIDSVTKSFKFISATTPVHKKNKSISFMNRFNDDILDINVVLSPVRLCTGISQSNIKSDNYNTFRSPH